MTDLLVHPRQPDPSGCVLNLTPESAGWRYVGFQCCRLSRGREMRGGEVGRESCIVVLSGTCDIAAGGRLFEQVGGRPSIFDRADPGAVYAPAGAVFTVKARDEAEVAICSAPGQPGRAPRLIGAADMTREVRGRGTNTRYIRNILSETHEADSLLVVEVITPGGHWSSYPPHKHDTAVPGQETALEEIYYHRLNPSQGFAFQRVYTDQRDIDETLCVHDGDLVMVPRGYHPVSAAHGYDLYYLNVMAGPQRQWVVRNDPDHAWLARDNRAPA